MSEDKLYVVRLFDGMDGEWMDITDAITEEEAKRIWNKKTKGGTYKTSYDDIDYYDIFPADTKMYFSEGRSQTNRLFHILWIKAVGTPDYNSKEWEELGNRLSKKGY